MLERAVIFNKVIFNIKCGKNAFWHWRLKSRFTQLLKPETPLIAAWLMLAPEMYVIKERKHAVILYPAKKETPSSEVHPQNFRALAISERRIWQQQGRVPDSHSARLKTREYLSNVWIWQSRAAGWVTGLFGWLVGFRQWAKLLAAAVWRVRVTQLRPGVTPPPLSAP